MDLFYYILGFYQLFNLDYIQYISESLRVQSRLNDRMRTRTDLASIINTVIESANIGDSFFSLLDDIFSNPKNEIIQACENLDLEKLRSIRSDLFDKLKEDIPFIQDCVLCPRKKGKLVAEDIYVIGKSLLNDPEDKCLKKIVRSLKTKDKSSDLSIEISDNFLNSSQNEEEEKDINLFKVCADLRVLVLELSDKVKHLQSRLDVLESDATKTTMKIQLLSDAILNVDLMRRLWKLRSTQILMV